MEVRDPVHGSIQILDEEVPIIEHHFFQRLRSVKQLGFSEYIFPGATHTRYIHSIGVMHTSSLVFNKLFSHLEGHQEYLKLKETLRLACLLHDIGHAPLSHSTESVMPKVSELKLPKQFVDDPNRQATHEDYTIAAIANSSFSEAFKAAENEFGIHCFRVAELITGKTTDEHYFTADGINYFPVLHQLVSSEMDCDRMDYLLRDSYFCGVSYGKFDLDWIIDNLTMDTTDGSALLAISERAMVTFDDFLLSRFHMFLMVYFHYRAVCLEKMLMNYFQSAPGEYKIPSDIEDYQEHDDHFLMKVLRKSENRWARDIVQNKIPPKVLEIFGEKDLVVVEKLEKFLNKHNIEFIKCSSLGRLSKYYSSQDPGYKIKVERIRGITHKETQYIDIEKATDLFTKYSSAHSVTRIHFYLDQLSKEMQEEIQSILKF